MGTNSDAPIGVFDSGVGGLSVLRAIHTHLPAESTLYVADQARVPYGSQPIEEVRSFSHQVAQILIARGAKLIVVACNTASAAALHDLRRSYPELPFVGMEPAVKPAAENTHSGVVGVLATPATFQGELYASVVERFARDVTVLQGAPLGLVEQIEAGDFNASQTIEILETALRPMLEKGIDTVVLGCTHYPFIIPQIQDIVGPDVRVIDPSPAIAAQTARVLAAMGLMASGDAEVTYEFLTTGDAGRMGQQLRRLLGIEADPKGL